MAEYSDEATHKFKLKNQGDNWLHKQQGLALPALPPTTSKVCKYFFEQIWKHAESASAKGRQTIDYKVFAQEWNETADGKYWFYVTVEILAGYSKA